MSQYEDYSTTSAEYDTTRQAVGVDVILGCLARSRVDLREQHVLETGCGTGNYLAAVRPYVGRVVGADLNDGMLAQAREKLGPDAQLVHADILDLPFDDKQFDGVLCIQVIHHLDQGPASSDDPATWASHDYPNINRYFREAYRVIRRGGAVVVNVSTQVQVVNAYWWAALIPTAVARMNCRLPAIDQLQTIITSAGFEIETVAADLHGILQGESYLDPNGPLRESWRAGDSTWSLATDEELARAYERVERMNREGTMQAFLAERERMRRDVGQSTFVCGRK